MKRVILIFYHQYCKRLLLQVLMLHTHQEYKQLNQCDRKCGVTLCPVTVNRCLENLNRRLNNKVVFFVHRQSKECISLILSDFILR